MLSAAVVENSGLVLVSALLPPVARNAVARNRVRRRLRRLCHGTSMICDKTFGLCFCKTGRREGELSLLGDEWLRLARRASILL